MNNKNKDIGGWLRRKGNRIHNWSRKWFVLRNNSLLMFSKDGDVKCLDTILLDKQIVSEPPVDLNDPKQGYFDIVNDNETISLCADTLEEKQTWLRALKRVLFAKRGGALFCQSLEEILFWEKTSGRRVPYIVDECVQYLYKYGLEVEGIFRLGGRLSSIKEVISRFDQGEKIEFEKEETDVHVVASVLKAFLRDLPDSLLPCLYYQKFMNIALRFMDAKDDAAKEMSVADLKSAMDLIPDDNYVILKYVCELLHKVSLNGEQNKMHMMNIGTIFGNNIIRHIDKENSQLLLCTADLGQNLVYMLLNYFDQVFIRELKEENSNHDVATADLLNMAELSTDPPSVVLAEQDICNDLKGLDLTAGSSSNGSIQVVEDYYRDPKVGESSESVGDVDARDEVRAKKRTLHLSLKRRPQVETATDSSVPSSPTSDTNPPIPPRRNRLIRNRPVSERNRPKGVHLSANNSRESSPPLPSPQTPNFHTPPETPTSFDEALPKINSRKSNTLPLPVSSTRKENDKDKFSSSQEIDANERNNSYKTEENLPSYEELLAENKRLKDSIALQKDRYKKDVSALRSQHTSLIEKYEERIKTMEDCFENQKKDLEMKLQHAKDHIAVAVKDRIELKEELSKYQLKYGELPF